MSSSAVSAAENTDLFFTVLKSVNEFDNAEVKGVLDTLLSPTDRDNCFIGTYYRVIGNVGTLLKLDKSKDFQAILMLARALFELAVDLRLLETISNGWIKLLAYAELEKLRAARKIINFKKNNPATEIETKIYDWFVSQHSARITGLQNSNWPRINPKHWSGLDLSGRVAQLGSPFDQIYAVDYPRISWYAHSGLTGVINLPAEGFIHLCAYAFHLSATAYTESLLVLIREFKLSKTNEKIENHLQAAKMLPFTKNPEQAAILSRLLR
jgi:hypothetical protein